MSVNPPSLIGKHPEVIEECLVLLFKELDNVGILWAVAHGWEGLPTYARHDVDLLVLPSDVKQIGEIIETVAKKTGWIHYGSFRSSNLTSHWIMRMGDEISYFKIDLFQEMTLRGSRFFSNTRTKRALSQRWKNENGIWCLTYGYAGASVLVKELIANGRLEGELRHQLVQNDCKKDVAGFSLLIEDACKDKDVAKKIVELCNNCSWDDLAGYAKFLKRGVLGFKFSNILGQIRYVYDYFRLSFFPYLRLFVAFVGPDGCGKTTICDNVAKYFDHRPFCGMMRLHFNFGNVVRLRDIKKFLCRLVGKKIEFEKEAPPGTRGIGMTPPHSCLKSMAYILFYGIQLALGRIALWKWRVFSSLIIADRYYYDYYYMRGHIKSPKWFKDLIGLIIPKPQIIFVLERPAEEIFRGKPELEIDEIKRQQKAIRDNFGKSSKVRFIDASKGVEQTVRQVQSEIEKWLISH